MARRFLLPHVALHIFSVRSEACRRGSGQTKHIRMVAVRLCLNEIRWNGETATVWRYHWLPQRTHHRKQRLSTSESYCRSSHFSWVCAANHLHSYSHFACGNYFRVRQLLNFLLVISKRIIIIVDLNWNVFSLIEPHYVWLIQCNFMRCERKFGKCAKILDPELRRNVNAAMTFVWKMWNGSCSRRSFLAMVAWVHEVVEI